MGLKYYVGTSALHSNIHLQAACSMCAMEVLRPCPCLKGDPKHTYCTLCGGRLKSFLWGTSSRVPFCPLGCSMDMLYLAGIHSPPLVQV